MNKPYSQACENNKSPILAVIKNYFTQAGTVLEIGSGTGQHAVYFAENLPHLVWQPSDVAEHLSGIESWRQDSQLSNIAEAIELDVRVEPWSIETAYGIYSANTAHIMSWSSVKLMLSGVAKRLKEGGYFCLYGPFNYQGKYTSESNQRFDGWLHDRDPESGLRDFEALDNLADELGLKLINDHEMPANNRTLVWQRL